MSVLFQFLLNTGRKHSFKKLLSPQIAACKCLYIRKSSDAPKKFASFDDVVAQRRAEARRSIVVQVNSEASFKELHGYCSKYASVNGIHHYKNSGGEHFMLIEFSTEDNLKDILKSCSAHQKDLDVMALQSPFLWFRATTGNKEKYTSPSVSLASKDGLAQVDEDKLFAELMACEAVSDQIQTLYDRTALNDLGVRLRYMVARQLECVFDSLYANIVVRPFGSSINGFGRLGCDLDLVLTNILTDDMMMMYVLGWPYSGLPLIKIDPSPLLPTKYFPGSDPRKRLVYQDKRSEGGRSPWQRHMEAVAELLELRVPGAARVTRILHARVPIVKYAHDFTDLECDLCYNNMSGVYMSELLWLYGNLDPRVRPLTFTVRRWAQTCGLTNQHPGRWITNFPLTLMVLFFLQQKTSDGCVLPTVKNLVNRAGKEDIRIAEENLNCTFLRNMNKLPTDTYSQNQSNLQTLLLQFFEFYSLFDFQEKAISINEGVAIRKPNNLPLYIVNPLEQALNVSRNVSYEECERLKLEVRNAAWQLEAADERKGDEWGILSLIEKKSTRGLKKLLRVGNSHRLVSLKDFFNDNESETQGDTLRNKLDRLTQKSDTDVEKTVKEMKETMTNGKEKKAPRMKYKNSQIASEVFRIMRNKTI